MAKTQHNVPSRSNKDKFFVKPGTKSQKKATKNKIKADSRDTSSKQGDFFIKPLEKNYLNAGANTNPEEQKNISESNSNVKKPFDKKKYRLKKYSNKYKIQQWEEKRKKAVLHKYHREIKTGSEPTVDVQKIYEDESMVDEGEDIVDHKKEKVFLKPHESFQRKNIENKKNKEEFLKEKAEREEAKRKAQKAKIERSKKLARKTKKGQPVMKYRMEMLLEKIQKSIKE